MDAKAHRMLNTLLVLALIITIGMYIKRHQHSIEDCEARLYEKITGQKNPDIKELK